jgi:hypothetical protein
MKEITSTVLSHAILGADENYTSSISASYKVRDRFN